MVPWLLTRLGIVFRRPYVIISTVIDEKQRFHTVTLVYSWQYSGIWFLYQLDMFCYSGTCSLAGFVSLNTLRPRQDGCQFLYGILKCIFLNEYIWDSLEISLKFAPKGPIDNIAALVQIMAWHRPGDKPLSEPMIVSLLTHICVTRPQWVK